MRTVLIALVAAVCALAAAPPAGAATYYVDQNHPSAANGNPGTEDRPWLTVDYACDHAVAGDTIIVKEGVYREAVTLSRSGTAGDPITLRAAPGQAVVISGADVITGWQPCTQEIAKGNPNYPSMYYADIGWRPGSLYQDGQPLAMGRRPNVGWYVAGGGTGTTLVDPLNLTQADGFWIGAEMFVWILSGTSQAARPIVGFDAASHTLTWTKDLGYGRVPTADTDRYFLRNKVEIIDAAGEWAVEDTSGGAGSAFRVWLWPADGASPNEHLIEGSRRSRFVIEWGAQGYWVFDGLELRHGAGHGIGCWTEACPGHNVVRNCSIHHNDATGIYGRFNENGHYYRSFVGYNKGSGISISDRGGVTVEECEVTYNEYDGVLVNGDNCTIRRNFIHGHDLWGHPDNLQTWGGQENLVIEENLVVFGGQSYMMEGCQRTTYRGNVIVGSMAYMLIFGHDTVFGVTLEKNTLCFPGYGVANHSWTNTGSHSDDFAYRNNIIVKGHFGSVWGIRAHNIYSSDWNLFYHSDLINGASTSTVVWDANYNWNFDQYVAASGHDAHSVYASPKFANFPTSYLPLAFGRYNDFSTDRVYVRDGANMALVSVGDRVEIDFDGVLRTVTAKGSDWVEVTPPDDRLAFKTGCLANWKTGEDFELDLTLDPNSPAAGAADDGSDLGSTINVRQFMRGDFDGDGLRDIPDWTGGGAPVTGPRILQWQLAADHGPAGEVATVLEDNYVEPRRQAARRLRIAFSEPLDPNTVSPGAVGIAGHTGGDLSGLVSAVALSGGDTVMTVDLSAALPNGDRYTITVSDAVASAAGETLGGVRSRQFAVLEGDVDGSGQVSAADILAARAHAGQVFTAEAARYDVDRSGTFTGRDVLVVRNGSGVALP